jgi:ABC-type multidrug transport system permease subunit
MASSWLRELMPSFTTTLRVRYCTVRGLMKKGVLAPVSEIRATGVLRGRWPLTVVHAFAYALSWLMAVVGLVVKSPEAAQSAVFLPTFPLVFASSVFVPTETFPSWLQGFADNQPVTVTANALRGLILGPGALPHGQTVSGDVILAVAWAAGIAFVFAPLAVRIYRRSVG